MSVHAAKGHDGTGLGWNIATCARFFLLHYRPPLSIPGTRVEYVRQETETALRIGRS